MKKVLSLFALAMAAVALVACGSSSNSTSTASAPASSGGGGGGGGGGSKAAGGGGGGSSVNVSSDPSGQLKFNTTKLTAKAGQDTFAFTNQAPIAHDFTIES